MHPLAVATTHTRRRTHACTHAQAHARMHTRAGALARPELGPGCLAYTALLPSQWLLCLSTYLFALSPAVGGGLLLLFTCFPAS